MGEGEGVSNKKKAVQHPTSCLCLFVLNKCQYWVVTALAPPISLYGRLGKNMIWSYRLSIGIPTKKSIIPYNTITKTRKYRILRKKIEYWNTAKNRNSNSMWVFSFPPNLHTFSPFHKTTLFSSSYRHPFSSWRHFLRWQGDWFSIMHF